MVGRITRRRVLAALATLGALSVFAFPSRLLPLDPLSRVLGALRGACRRDDILLTLGRACAKQPTSHVMHHSDEEIAVSFEQAAGQDRDFAAWYRDATMSDFDDGRVVRVDGWVISETEFRLLSAFASRNAS
jgi:hypothetical protein